MTKPNILFLADTTHPAGAVHDHINAITNNDLLSWHVLNPLLCKTLDKLDFNQFDAIGIHYSIKIYNDYYFSEKLKRKIADFAGTKFVFLQDEYQRVNEVQDILIHLKVTLLFTLVDQSLIKKAYPDSRLSSLKTITVLTGYVSSEMKLFDSPEIKTRTIDVSYRGRRCDFWLGSLAYEKQFIAEEFSKVTKNTSIVTDISIAENDRLYGDAWFALLKNSKAVLGTESGASIWDFDRAIEIKTKAYLQKHRGAPFAQVHQAVLQPHDGKIMYNAISPRVFEAAATKTPMIMFPGDYSHVCVADKHYIALEKDFSNISSVLMKLKDVAFLQQMANDTYNELIASDRYSHYQLSKLVTNEILKTIHNNNYSPKEGVSKAIESTISKHKLLNTTLIFLTEFRFILSNILTLLTDNEYSFSQRCNRAFKGMKRYVTYLLPRLKN